MDRVIPSAILSTDLHVLWIHVLYDDTNIFTFFVTIYFYSGSVLLATEEHNYLRLIFPLFVDRGAHPFKSLEHFRLWQWLVSIDK